MTETNSPSNKILAAVPAQYVDHVFSKLELVPLEFGKHIHSAYEPIRYLYFPLSGIISLVSSAEDSGLVEVGMMGNEGVAGFPVALGVDRTESSTVVQGAGTAQRISAKDYSDMSDTITPLRMATLRFIHGLMTQTSLTAACNAFHQADKRLARWLLMMHDRMGVDEFELTQEFLSQMLGVRREAVNKHVGELRGDGLVTYTRGNMIIKDRPGLVNRACPCYREIAAAYDNYFQ